MTEERSTLQEEFFDEAMGIRRFHTIDGETMMDKQIAPQEFAVAEILPYGMTVLSGPSKAGKSFLTLNLCLSVAKGEPFLGFPTKKGTVLYLGLEDTEGRIQRRALTMGDDMPKTFHFTNEIYKINDGLIPALEDFVKTYPDTVLIAIDVLEYVRPSSRGGNLYKEDYADMAPLHQFTQRHKVALVLVNHTNKRSGGDPFDASTGSTAIVGAADGYMLLRRPKRTERRGILFCSGREVVDREIELRMDDDCVWRVSDGNEYVPEELNPTVRAVYLYVCFRTDLFETRCFECTPSTLAEGIKAQLGIEIPVNMITKHLTLYHHQLEHLGLRFKSKRTNKSRLLGFEKNSPRLRRLIATYGSLPEEIDESPALPEFGASDGVTAEVLAENSCHPDDVICLKVSSRRHVRRSVTAKCKCASSRHAVTEEGSEPLTPEEKVWKDMQEDTLGSLLGANVRREVLALQDAK